MDLIGPSYKVTYTAPSTGRKETKWIPVDDVTSVTLKLEKQKQQIARRSIKKTKGSAL